MNRLIRRAILFVIRKKLGLKLYEGFQFTNQKSETNWYVFTRDAIMKVCYKDMHIKPSGVSLNHLLSNSCSIKKINKGKKQYLKVLGR